MPAVAPSETPGAQGWEDTSCAGLRSCGQSGLDGGRGSQFRFFSGSAGGWCSPFLPPSACCSFSREHLSPTPVPLGAARGTSVPVPCRILAAYVSRGTHVVFSIHAVSFKI